MHVPKAFLEDRTDVLHEAMKEIGAATIVGQGAHGLIATHAPIELDPEPAPFGTVRVHFARANPHAGAIEGGDELLLIFQGPEGYVTPSWYPTKYRTGKVVPTWNYIAVHAYGTATAFDDAKRLQAHLAKLTGRFESGHDHPWTLEDAPKTFIDGMCRAIVGFDIALSRIEGQWKMSQNKGAEDRMGVVDGFRTRGDDHARRMAGLVEAAAFERRR